MDPFARFRQNRKLKSVRKLPEQMTRGHLYTATSFERKLSDYKAKDGSNVYNMISHFKDERNVNSYVYMGSDFNNPTEDEINAFNELIKNGKPPKIVFYGFLGKSKIMDLLQHDEEINVEQLESCTETETAIKRSSSSGSDVSAKMPNLDSSSEIK